MGRLHIDWWETVKELPSRHRFVAHEPETPRYARARQKLRYLMREGNYLGSIGTHGVESRIEIAVWAPPDQRRGPGFHACFRLFIEDAVTTGAVLYCFYDGARVIAESFYSTGRSGICTGEWLREGN